MYIPYTSITIAGNGTTENYIRVSKEILNVIDVKYDGDLVTYISLKDLKILGTVDGNTVYNNKPLYIPGIAEVE